MESLYPYIPADRQFAIAQGVDLPDHTTGAALFADISGFTKLTDALVQTLGPQRGAEELPRWLNRIYDGLIADVTRYRGSVISFSGDAITCWFDDHNLAGEVQEGHNPGALRAIACALAIQQTMEQFSQVDIPGSGTVSLEIKVAVSAGSARRFLVGDPEILIIDVLAGKTLDRLAASAEHAKKGEIVLDEMTVLSLAEQVSVSDWRSNGGSGARFALLVSLDAMIEPDPWPSLLPDALNEEQLRPWLLQPVYERLKSGMGEFLTELRPAIALFLRFGGIDYDMDMKAQSKLDMYIQAVQHILDRYSGYMLQLALGDKGCYLYASFGVPTAHEDDAVRVVSAALELRDFHMDFITNVQIGISQGRMRTGAYGSPTRRTYGVLGDDVNLAARLMENAPPGQVLVNQNIYKATDDVFSWEELAPLQVKGKPQPVNVLRLIAKKSHRSSILHEPYYSLPMVGRAAELSVVRNKLDLVLLGWGQVISITAEAGMGKSRLVAEIIRVAREHNVLGYGGECQSYGTNTSYLVWQNIWRGFFGLDAAWPLAEQVAILEHQLAKIDQALLPRLPLLGAVLNLQIPDNELTGAFNAKLRKESLESLLADCLRKRIPQTPLILVLEDGQWLDPLSHDLLETLGRAAADLAVMIVLAYRPNQLEPAQALRISSLPNYIEIALKDLPPNDIAQLITFKLRQVYGEQARVPAALIEQISARADGNPFYIEELLNYLHDRGIDPQHPNAFEQIDLPTSLYSLILSRIDQLSESQKTLLKVASVIGRLFRVAMLWGIYNQLGDQEHVHHELDVLSRIDLTQLDISDPELTYLFKHVLTQEVAYETLPFETRAMLHEQIGQYIEAHYRDSLDQYINLLAFHYERTDNLSKKREYLTWAGEAAQAAYANSAAISYYQRVLPLLPEERQVAIMLKMGAVQELVGNWQAANDTYLQSESLSLRLKDGAGCAQAQRMLGSLLRKGGEYSQAETWLERARESYHQLDDVAGISHVLAEMGDVYRMQGKYPEARSYYDQSLELTGQIVEPQHRQAARAKALKGAGTVATWQGDYAAADAFNKESLSIHRDLGDVPGVATLLNNMGIIARFQRNLSSTVEKTGQENSQAVFFRESLALFQKIGDRWAAGQLLNNLACAVSDQGEYAEARRLLEESLFICRQLGDKAGLAGSLNTLADVLLDEGDYTMARPLLDESLSINREIGDQAAIAYLIEDYGCVAAAEGNPQRALQLAGFAAALRETIGAPLPPSEQARLDKLIAPARQNLQETDAAAAWESGRSLSLEQAIELARAVS
jgi:predicted ATPase/class 3 adenylate cyclase